MDFIKYCFLVIVMEVVGVVVLWLIIGVSIGILVVFKCGWWLD